MVTAEHYFGLIFMKHVDSIFKRGDENHCEYRHRWVIHIFIGNKEYDIIVWQKTNTINPYASH
jgi:hypothetical protein